MIRTLQQEFLRVLESGSSILQQVFSGLRTVRSFSGEAQEKARFDTWIKEHWDIKAKTETLHNVILVLPTHIVDRVLMGVIFGVGAFEIINGRLTVGDLIAFMMYTPYVYTALRAMLRAQVTTEKIKVAIEALDGFFDMEEERQGGRELTISQETGPSIEFDNVSFDYGRGRFRHSGCLVFYSARGILRDRRCKWWGENHHSGSLDGILCASVGEDFDQWC